MNDYERLQQDGAQQFLDQINELVGEGVERGLTVETIAVALEREAEMVRQIAKVEEAMAEPEVQEAINRGDTTEAVRIAMKNQGLLGSK